MLETPGLPAIHVEQRRVTRMDAREASRIPKSRRGKPVMGRRSRLPMPTEVRSASEPPRMSGEPADVSLPPLDGRQSAMEISIDTEVRATAGREFRLAKARQEMQRLSSSTDTALIMQCLRKHANGAPELKPVWVQLQSQLRRVSGLTVGQSSSSLREPEPEPEPEPQGTMDLAEVLRRADETL
jgi:hypothetical protein